MPERKFLPQGINHGERFAEAEEASKDFFVCDRRKEDRKIRSADCLRYHGKINRMKNYGKGRIKTEREGFVILLFSCLQTG